MRRSFAAGLPVVTLGLGASGYGDDDSASGGGGKGDIDVAMVNGLTSNPLDECFKDPAAKLEPLEYVCN